MTRLCFLRRVATPVLRTHNPKAVAVPFAGALLSDGQATYTGSMKLWTWHSRGFSLLDGYVDHERSEYVKTVKGARGAYEELAARVGTTQLVWCYTVEGVHIASRCHTEVEWVLNVPTESILRFVDDIVWNRIWGTEGECAVPTVIWCAWLDKARRRFPNDIAAQEKYERELKKAFWAQQPAGESWWDSLFKQEQACEGVCALVPHPIKREWIVVNPISDNSAC